MLTIPCPHCGMRDETEFLNGGEAAMRPERPEDLSDDEWSAWLFTHDNPRGPLDERWFHAFGCRRWLVLRRDTVTHAISDVRTMSEYRASQG